MKLVGQFLPFLSCDVPQRNKAAGPEKGTRVGERGKHCRGQFRGASHYANEPTIAGYDMLNEPGAPSDGDWQVFGQRLRDTITAVDHNHFVVYEATKNDSPPLRGNNVVYSDHDYPGSEAYPQSWPRSTPLLIGEFGSQPTDNGPTGWVQNQIARYRSDGVHWTFFVMREGSNGFGLYACGGAGDFRCPWGEMILIVQQGMAGSVKP